MYFKRAMLSLTVNVAICCPSASTAGWTSLFACDVAIRLAMGMWLKHSGIALLGSFSIIPTVDPRLAMDGRRGAIPGRPCCCCSSGLPPLTGLLPFPPISAGGGGATTALASFACALRAAFSAFCCAFNCAFVSFGGFAAGAEVGGTPPVVAVEGEADGAGVGAGVAEASLSAGAAGAAPLASVAI